MQSSEPPAVAKKRICVERLFAGEYKWEEDEEVAFKDTRALTAAKQPTARGGHRNLARDKKKRKYEFQRAQCDCRF
jgi:hypothetical protein